MLDLSKDKKAEIFDSLYKEYVAEHGLGGMSKGDLDALLLWLVATRLKKIDVFQLSTEFKIKEARVKSLLETAAVKFDDADVNSAWLEILDLMSTVEYDIESLEKGQIRFQLNNPMLYRWLQDKVRSLGATCHYHRASEQVTLNLDTVYHMMDRLWEADTAAGWTEESARMAQPKIQKTIGNIGKKIARNTLQSIRAKKASKVKDAIESAKDLKNLADLISPLWEKVTEALAK